MAERIMGIGESRYKPRWPETAGGRGGGGRPSPQVVGGVAQASVPGGGGGSPLGSLLGAASLGFDIYDKVWGPGAALKELQLENTRAMIDLHRSQADAALNKAQEENYQRLISTHAGREFTPELGQAYAGARPYLIAPYGRGPKGESVRGEPRKDEPEPTDPEYQMRLGGEMVAPPQTLARTMRGAEQGLREETVRGYQTMPPGPTRERLIAQARTSRAVPLPSEGAKVAKGEAEAGTAMLGESKATVEQSNLMNFQASMNEYRKTGREEYLWDAMSFMVGGAEKLAAMNINARKAVLEQAGHLDRIMRDYEMAVQSKDRAKSDFLFRQLNQESIARSRLYQRPYEDPDPLVDFFVNGLGPSWNPFSSGTPMRKILRVKRSVAEAYLNNQLNPADAVGLQHLAELEIGIQPGADGLLDPTDAQKLKEYVKTRPGNTMESITGVNESVDKQTRGYVPPPAALGPPVAEMGEFGPEVGGPGGAAPPAPTQAPAAQGLPEAPGMPGQRAAPTNVMTLGEVGQVLAPGSADPEYQALDRYVQERYKTNWAGLPPVLQQRALQEFRAAGGTRAYPPPAPPATPVAPPSQPPPSPTGTATEAEIPGSVPPLTAAPQVPVPAPARARPVPIPGVEQPPAAPEAQQPAQVPGAAAPGGVIPSAAAPPVPQAPAVPGSQPQPFDMGPPPITPGTHAPSTQGVPPAAQGVGMPQRIAGAAQDIGRGIATEGRAIGQGVVAPFQAVRDYFSQRAKSVPSGQTGPSVLDRVRDVVAPAPGQGRRVTSEQTRQWQATYGPIADQAADRYGVPREIVRAIIEAETGGTWNPRAEGRDGELGLMQLMPGTGRDMGLVSVDDFFDPARNIDAGTKYIAWLSQRYSGSLPLAVAAYRAGFANIEKGQWTPLTQSRMRAVFGKGFSEEELDREFAKAGMARPGSRARSRR